jgi:hypothetical protein
MTTIENICAHRIEFNYHSSSKNATPNDSEIEHVREQLNDNYKQGELCMIKLINNREYEFRGWWKIVN